MSILLESHFDAKNYEKYIGWYSKIQMSIIKQILTLFWQHSNVFTMFRKIQPISSLFLFLNEDSEKYLTLGAIRICRIS